VLKSRLERLKWLYTDHPVYFLTAGTAERRKLLNQPFVHAAFIAFSKAAATRGVLVGRYVLMPDHVHCFAGFRPDSLSVSRWIQSLKVKLAEVLLKNGCSAPYWQKGFFDHVLRSAESYAEKWEYVRLNPVRAGLVERPEDWPYQGEIQRLEVL
jgi:REP-associated tyrosine transposase